MLDKDKILKLLNKNQSFIQSAYSVKNIGLFGSYVHACQNENSDVNILVEFNDINFDNYMELKFYLERLFSHPVDLVLSDSVKPILKPYIERDVIYAA